MITIETDNRIKKLNKKIVANNRRIKNLEIRDNMIMNFSFVLVVGSNIVGTLKNYDSRFVQDFCSFTFLTSVFIGCLPSVYLPTERTKRKINICKEEIKLMLDELHGYAIEDDKKIMQKKM